VQEQQHPAGVRSRGGKPVGWHPGRVHLCHQNVVGHRKKATSGGEGGAALFQRHRGLTGTGLLTVPEGVDQVLHCLTGHIGASP
jgi:hypothetical protein